MTVMAEREIKVGDEVSVRQLRETMADVINEAAVYGRVIHITSRTRRVAAVVSEATIEELEDLRAEVTRLRAQVTEFMK